MPLELYMIGLIVKDMPTALTFYQRLGLDIPEVSDTQAHVEIKMGNMTFFLDSKPERWDPGFGKQPDSGNHPASNDYPSLLEFYLKEQRTLEAKFAELVNFGYEGFREPYLTSFGMCFAMIKDPDGNAILLSADAAPQESSNQ
jgi:uncharacterized glyoxalase superfamily protein PhnB